MQRRLSFQLGVLFEVALLFVALAWGLIFGESVTDRFTWSFRDAVVGVLAALPLFGFFVWSLRSELPVFLRHREVLDSLIPRLFEGWSVMHWAVISVCAGVCEEVLFRGAIQNSLDERIGTTPSLILVALLFGASHLLSWTYGIFAALIGGYVGLLFLESENLLVPIIVHALYDFLALVYYFRVYRQRH